MRAAFVWLFLLGATLVTSLDAVHTHTGTTEYAHPVWFRAAWWAPLLFAGSTSIGGWLYARGYERWGGPARVPQASALAKGLLAMSVLYASSGLLPASTTTKLAVLLTGSVVLFQSLDGSRAGALLVLSGVVVGPLVEIALVRAGLFRYRIPEGDAAIAGVPIWLPALYGCVTPVIGQLARRLLSRAPTAALTPRRSSSREAPAP